MRFRNSMDEEVANEGIIITIHTTALTRNVAINVYYLQISWKVRRLH